MSKIGSSVLEKNRNLLFSGISDMDKAGKIIKENNLTVDEIAFIRQADFRKDEYGVKTSIKYPSKLEDRERGLRHHDLMYGDKVVKELVEKGIINRKIIRRTQKIRPGSSSRTYYEVDKLEWTKKGLKIRSILKPQKSKGKITISEPKEKDFTSSAWVGTFPKLDKNGNIIIDLEEHPETKTKYKTRTVTNGAAVLTMSRYTNNYILKTPSRGEKANVQILEFNLTDKHYNEDLNEFIINNSVLVGKDRVNDEIYILNDKMLKTMRFLQREQDILIAAKHKGFSIQEQTPETLQALIKGWKLLE